jgi:AhpD family alkylhydroperoxidase
MQARIKNPATVVPDAMPALLALNAVVEKSGVDPKLLSLVHMRISQINGCSTCVDGGRHHAKKVGESDDRLFAVTAWREMPYFSDAERAALALAESATRLSDRPDPVPDAIWDEAAKHYDEKTLCALVLQIAVVNVWNRLNVTTRQPGGLRWS